MVKKYLYLLPVVTMMIAAICVIVSYKDIIMIPTIILITWMIASSIIVRKHKSMYKELEIKISSLITLVFSLLLILIIVMMIMTFDNYRVIELVIMFMVINIIHLTHDTLCNLV